jgi:hypothetical protein
VSDNGDLIDAIRGRRNLNPADDRWDGLRGGVTRESRCRHETGSEADGCQDGEARKHFHQSLPWVDTGSAHAALPKNTGALQQIIEFVSPC